jgi:hypothetical protein
LACRLIKAGWSRRHCPFGGNANPTIEQHWMGCRSLNQNRRLRDTFLIGILVFSLRSRRQNKAQGGAQRAEPWVDGRRRYQAHEVGGSQMGDGEICGFRVIEDREGEIEVVLYYGDRFALAQVLQNICHRASPLKQKKNRGAEQTPR